MLYQELPRIESTPLGGWARWLAPALVLGAALSAPLLLLLTGQPLIAGAAGVPGTVGAVLALLRGPGRPPPSGPLLVGPGLSVGGAALGRAKEPAALTTGEGSLLIANAAYRQRFEGSRAPLELGVDEDARQALSLARTMAWRDGAGCVAGVSTSA